MTKAVFTYTSRHRADDFHGEMDYTVSETLIARDGGLEITSHAKGWDSGERIDQKETKFYPGADIAKAIQYRRTHGYTEVK